MLHRCAERGLERGRDLPEATQRAGLTPPAPPAAAPGERRALSAEC